LGSSKNKLEFQKSFIEWLKDEYKDDIPIYLGGAVSNDVTLCIKVSRGSFNEEPELRCFHEEADDRLLFHVNHGIKIDNIKKVIVCSPDRCICYFFVSF